MMKEKIINKAIFLHPKSYAISVNIDLKKGKQATKPDTVETHAKSVSKRHNPDIFTNLNAYNKALADNKIIMGKIIQLKTYDSKKYTREFTKIAFDLLDVKRYHKSRYYSQPWGMKRS